MAKPAGGREKTKNRKQGPAGGTGLTRVGFCLKSWVPEVFGPPASSRMVFERRQPRTLPVINGFKIVITRFVFFHTGPGPAGSGQRTLHPRVFLFFLFGGLGPQGQRAGAHLPIHQPRIAPCWRRQSIDPLRGRRRTTTERRSGGRAAAASGRRVRRAQRICCLWRSAALERSFGLGGALDAVHGRMVAR